MKNKLIAIALGIALVFPTLTFAQTSNSSSSDNQTILTTLLQQLLTLYESELEQLEAQLTQLQNQQSTLENEVNGTTSYSLASPASSTDDSGQIDSEATSTESTSTFTPSQTLSQIESTTPEVVTTTNQESGSDSVGGSEPEIPTTTVTVSLNPNATTTEDITNQNSDKILVGSFILTSSATSQPYFPQNFQIETGSNSSKFENLIMYADGGTSGEKQSIVGNNWQLDFAPDGYIGFPVNSSSMEIDLYADAASVNASSTNSSIVAFCGSQNNINVFPDYEFVDSNGNPINSSTCLYANQTIVIQ